MKLGKKRLKLTFHQHPAGMFIKTIISVFSGFEPISNVLSRVILPQSGIAPQSGSIFGSIVSIIRSSRFKIHPQ